MLALSTLREIPDELANRMMVAHGSRQLLRAIRGEPLELPPTAEIIDLKPRRPRKGGYVPVASRPATTMPTAVREIVTLVAEVFGLTIDDLTGKRRQRYLTLARALAVRLIRDRTNASGEPLHSLPRIGGYLGRDHSTISHALSMFDTYCRHYPELADAYRVLSEKLGEGR